MFTAVGWLKWLVGSVESAGIGEQKGGRGVPEPGGAWSEDSWGGILGLLVWVGGERREEVEKEKWWF